MKRILISLFMSMVLVSGIAVAEVNYDEIKTILGEMSETINHMITLVNLYQNGTVSIGLNDMEVNLTSGQKQEIMDKYQSMKTELIEKFNQLP